MAKIKKRLKYSTIFNLAIRLRPDFANAHYNLGSEYQRLGNFAAAIDEFKQALLLQPCYAQAYNNLGTAYFDLAQYDKAIVAYREAVRCQGDLAIPFRNLSYAYLITGQRANAVAVLEWESVLNLTTQQLKMNWESCFT